MAERWSFMMDLCVEYVKRGEYVIPFNLLSKFITGKLEHIANKADSPSDFQQLELQHTYLTVCEALYLNLQQGKAELPWLPGWTVMRLGILLGLKPQARFAPYIIPAYSRSRYLGEIAYDDFALKIGRSSSDSQHTSKRMPLVVTLIICLSLTTNLVLVVFLLSCKTWQAMALTFKIFAADIKAEVLQILEAQYGGEHGRTEFLNKLGPSYAEAAKDTEVLKFGALEEALSQPASPLLQAEPTSLSASPSYPSSFADSESASVSSSSSSSSSSGLTSMVSSPGPWENYSTLDRTNPNYCKHTDSSRKISLTDWYPHLAIARLIQAFGRAGDLEKVRELYTVAQDVFPLLDPNIQLEAGLILRTV
jgi:hypothetical protein